MEGKQIVGAVVETVAKEVIAAQVMMFIYRYSIMAYDYGYRIFGEEAVDAEPGRDVTVEVTESDSPQDVGQMLEQKGLIRDATLFVIQEKLAGLENGIAPGTYNLNTAMTVEEMMEIMATASRETESEE